MLRARRRRASTCLTAPAPTASTPSIAVTPQMTAQPRPLLRSLSRRPSPPQLFGQHNHHHPGPPGRTHGNCQFLRRNTDRNGHIYLHHDRQRTPRNHCNVGGFTTPNTAVATAGVDLPVGTDNVTATYAASGSFAGSASAPMPFTVTPERFFRCPAIRFRCPIP